MSEPAIQFVRVEYRVPGRATAVLGPFDLDVARGETIALVGASGSGKTTALRLINALVLPTAGEVLVDGKATAAQDAVALRRRIGYVIQEAGLLPHYSVERNVGVVPALLGWPAERTRARVRDLLRIVGLSVEEHGARLPHELSGGQRQRVGVARALAADPPILLLDEPFGALDPLIRAALQYEFCALQQSLGKTAVFVTHDLREALLVGSRVALLDRGRVELVETPAAFRASQHPLARAWMATITEPDATSRRPHDAALDPPQRPSPGPLP